MVQLSTLAALLVSIPLTLAHPGENVEAIKNEMAMRNVQHAKASRSLSNCQSNANSVALRARTAARRAEKTKQLRAKRGLVNRKYIFIRVVYRRSAMKLKIPRLSLSSKARSRKSR